MFSNEKGTVRQNTCKETNQGIRERRNTSDKNMRNDTALSNKFKYDNKILTCSQQAATNW